MKFLSQHKDGCLINIKVVPNAPKSMIDKKSTSSDERLKIRLNAPPVDNKANEELVAFIAEILSIKKSGITLLSGDKSRNKQILVVLASTETIAARLSVLIGKN